MLIVCKKIVSIITWVSINLNDSVCVQQVFYDISQDSPHQHEPYEEASSALRGDEFAAGCGLLHSQRNWTQPSGADRAFWSDRPHLDALSVPFSANLWLGLIKLC